MDLTLPAAEREKEVQGGAGEQQLNRHGYSRRNSPLPCPRLFYFPSLSSLISSPHPLLSGFLPNSGGGPFLRNGDTF